MPAPPHNLPNVEMPVANVGSPDLVKKTSEEVPEEELSSSMLESADDTGMHSALSAATRKAPPLPMGASRPSAPPAPAMIAAGLTRASTPPPPHVKASVRPPPISEELSSSALHIDDGSYSFVSTRTNAKSGKSLPPGRPSEAPPLPSGAPKSPSMSPKSMPPPPPSPSKAPPPLVRPEELSSSLLVSEASGAYPMAPPKVSRPMATMLGGVAVSYTHLTLPTSELV